MRGHIADDQWIDVVDGVASPEVRAHLAACAGCRSTADEVRGGWALASEAEVPEPSPLYWESFRRRVGQAIAQESGPRARGFWLPLGGILAAAASLIVAVSLWMNATTAVPEATGTLATLEAWSPLPAADEDEALPVLVATSAELDASAACADMASCVDELSEDEAQGLEEALREELGGHAL